LKARPFGGNGFRKQAPLHGKPLSKKSLIRLFDVQGEWSNPQVLFSPRMPNAFFGHLPAAQGKETATGMAPPRREGNRWDALLSYS